MKKIFYILALGIGLAGCSNNEDELLPTGTFPGERVISVITEVNEPLSRAGYDATNLERFGLMIRNSENAAYNYHKQMVGSGNTWNTSDGQQMLWDTERTPVMMIAYAPYTGEATPDAPLAVNVLTNQSAEANVMASDFLLMKATVDPEKDLTADGKLKISLNHAMSKLIIKLTVNGTEDADMSKLGDMAVNGAVVNGTCDLSAAAPVVVPAADAAVATVAPYKGTEYCECILPPANDSGRLLHQLQLRRETVYMDCQGSRRTGKRSGTYLDSQCKYNCAIGWHGSQRLGNRSA